MHGFTLLCITESARIYTTLNNRIDLGTRSIQELRLSKQFFQKEKCMIWANKFSILVWVQN